MTAEEIKDELMTGLKLVAYKSVKLDINPCLNEALKKTGSEVTIWQL